MPSRKLLNLLLNLNAKHKLQKDLKQKFKALILYCTYFRNVNKATKKLTVSKEKMNWKINK